MTLHIELTEEQEQRLRARAAERGLDAQAYLLDLAERDMETERERQYRLLREAGLTTRPFPRGITAEEFEAFVPLALPGEPVSETIIRDRR
jgi:hypothetical protein